ncbi:MAG: methyl-viologen-reducing hydrogenase subunit delta [Thermoprotei archaeon]|nr:MAG: methyl-viologen-reducing hydrogenase subunit delta [Thermoprotei archaeon]
MYEPKIIAFLCRWCASAAADLAGVSRLSYPANIIPIVVPCSGRVDPRAIIEAFLNGADGVLIGGCHTPNDCHYISGNFKAFKRIHILKKLLKQFGIEPERIRLEWISATEATKLVQVTKDFVETIRKLGPLAR